MWLKQTMGWPYGSRSLVHDLTWDSIDVPIGASQTLQGCHFPRPAHTQQGRGSSSSVGEEQVEDVEEVEEEFSIDDHDLSSDDEEDAINVANGDGENMGANEDCDFNGDY